jgi:alkyl sulfatase BDS1-like metallo-beta-lactamase superfamily hydrolase
VEVDKSIKPASRHTIEITSRRRGLAGSADFDRATRGLRARHPTGVIEVGGAAVYDANRYAFLSQGGDTPETVHPTLWRQAQLNAIHGLFEVAPGVWQARGYDISNVTFVQGETGWIIIDPLTVAPTAKACLELANETLGQRPVSAVIYTHSHADHFGGVLGVVSREQVASGDCRVIAPEGFLAETVGENVVAGPAMLRRAVFQFGPLLPAGERGHVDCGLGKAIPFWQSDLIAPTESITETGQEMVVDGVKMVFQLTPGTEAPSEMNFYFPDRKWLCTAENCTATMHNLVPIRGALVRDALAWSKYINETIEMFASQAEVQFASHNWPNWGNEAIVVYLGLQRDLYRWMHDQTMRQANHGMTATEIAEFLKLPDEFALVAHTIGHYGDLVHNVKAVYQRYLSWYDANPSRLWELPPEQSAKHYVDLAGGPENLLSKARQAFDDGDYRWVSQLVAHLVFADPDDERGRELLADAFEQLGYQSQSATFRNAYLQGAQELRFGTPARQPVTVGRFVESMTVEQIVDTMAVRLKAEEVGGLTVSVGLVLTDRAESWTVHLTNRCLHATAAVEPGEPGEPDAIVELSTSTLMALLEGMSSLDDLAGQGHLILAGDKHAVEAVFGHLDRFETFFPVVTP